VEERRDARDSRDSTWAHCGRSSRARQPTHDERLISGSGEGTHQLLALDLARPQQPAERAYGRVGHRLRALGRLCRGPERGALELVDGPVALLARRGAVLDDVAQRALEEVALGAGGRVRGVEAVGGAVARGAARRVVEVVEGRDEGCGGQEGVAWAEGGSGDDAAATAGEGADLERRGEVRVRVGDGGGGRWGCCGRRVSSRVRGCSC